MCEAVIMKKQYERYFGKNIATLIYILSAIVAIAGLIVTFFRWWHFGFIFTIIGAIVFFITVRLKITDKDLDAKLSDIAEKYKTARIQETIVNRKPLDPEPFDIFSGYVCDSADCKAKIGSDGKVRSSHLFVTAIQADRHGFNLFYSVYDLFENQEPVHTFLNSDGVSVLDVDSVEVKIPHGIKKHSVHYRKDNAEQTFVFYAQDDALVDELIRKIKEKKS